MKPFVALLAVAAGMVAFAPMTAEAGKKDRHSRHHHKHHNHHYSHDCGHCGHKVRKVRQLVGYDCGGCPIYRWVVVSHRCKPAHHQRYRHHDWNRRYDGCRSGYYRNRDNRAYFSFSW
ncbi:hypothetical protein [Sulfuriroseicoccus oceanibius]|uniref:Uncharacterized protein n=1 Tax=Sulfuriroseicoccus oceanibius TaxID=2707525 RepID=A0A6B3LCE6_9BACT|nr:hypothetical protein [Sulfuriroseicoccus oceanibius]QQL45960.1 hypothetical protein G3M56_005110 [Sulfuriroseicoccus oceanibius]